MIDTYKFMKRDYDPRYINQNFKKYLENRNHKVDKLLPDLDLTPLAETLSNRILPVERVLENISNQDYMSIRKIIGLGKKDEADHFADLIERLRNTKNMEAIARVKYGQDNLEVGFEAGVDNKLLDEIWAVYGKYVYDEQRLVQIGFLEQQRRGLQKRLEDERKKIVYLKDGDDIQRNEARIAGLVEEINGTANIIEMYMGKLSLESTGKYNNPYPQKITKASKLIPKDKNKTTYENKTYKDVAIRWEKTGERITVLKPGQKFDIRNGQVLIENPVTLKPVVDFEIVDAAALADAVGLTSYARIWDDPDTQHLKRFKSIVNNTKSNIRKAIAQTAGANIKDWGTNEIRIIEAIESGARQIKDLALEDVGNTIKTGEDARQLVPTAFGKLSNATKDYPSAFFHAMLMPDQATNPNEFHYFKGELIPAYKALNPSVVKHTLSAMKRFGVHDNFNEFLGNLAKEHSSWLNAYMGNGSITDRINDLATSSWEKSFLYKNIHDAYHSPFMRPDEYKSMEQYMDAYVGDSEFMNIMQGILEGRSIIDPTTLYAFRSKIRTELGHENYEKIWKFAGKDVLGSIDGGRIHAKGEGEGQLLAQIIYDRPFLNEWNSSLTHKANKNTVKDFNDLIVEQRGNCRQ